MITFTSLNDYFKDKSFLKLASEIKRDQIGVTRGKQGVTQTVSIYKLVVGDVVLLEPGCMIPADSILVAGEDLIVNESSLYDDRAHAKKTVASEENKEKGII